MSTTGETLSLDNNRPVEVTYIPEATFDDILDIGVAKLAVRDATVIERITERGYDEYLTRVAQSARTGWIPATKTKSSLSKAIIKQAVALKSDTMSQRLIDWYENFRHDRTGVVSNPMCDVSFEHGFSQSEKTKSFQKLHFDANMDNVPSATINATLFTASKRPWSWRLSVPGADENPAHGDEVDVPLVAGGWVILGENARTSPLTSAPCTVAHEVISPESAWSGKNVKRARILLFN